MKGRHGCGDGCGIIVASRPRWRVVIGLGHELGQLCQQPGKDRDKGGDRGQGDKDDRHSDDRDRHALAVNDALDSYVEFRHKKLKMRYQSADASPSGSGRPERPSWAAKNALGTCYYGRLNQMIRGKVEPGKTNTDGPSTGVDEAGQVDAKHVVEEQTRPRLTRKAEGQCPQL